jgi:hypothetical protein
MRGFQHRERLRRSGYLILGSKKNADFGETTEPPKGTRGAGRNDDERTTAKEQSGRGESDVPRLDQARCKSEHQTEDARNTTEPHRDPNARGSYASRLAGAGERPLNDGGLEAEAGNQCDVGAREHDEGEDPLAVRAELARDQYAADQRCHPAGH